MTTVGTVQFFNIQRGFGFIKPDNGGRDVFLHVSALEAAGLQPLHEGDRISFDVEPGRAGKMQATNLALLD